MLFVTKLKEKNVSEANLWSTKALRLCPFCPYEMVCFMVFGSSVTNLYIKPCLAALFQ